MSSWGYRARAGDGRPDIDKVRLPLTDLERAPLINCPSLASAHLIRIPEAARITGLPSSTLRKSFMRDEKRPRNIPPPPPHKRIGRAVYIIARELPAWIENIGRASDRTGMGEKRGRGRPTVAERIRRRDG
jgi:hypothetical protein